MGKGRQMKFRVTFKDPDTLYECVNEEAKRLVNYMEDIISTKEMGFTDEEKEILADARATEMAIFAKQWMEFGEYITIEFDTKTGTAIVVPKGE